MTRWYLFRRNGCIMLTCERIEDAKGYTLAWPEALGGGQGMRRTMRAGLHLLRQRVALIDIPVQHVLYDSVEVAQGNDEGHNLPPANR